MGSWPQACSLKGRPTPFLPGMEPPPVPAESLAMPQCPDENVCCDSVGRWGREGKGAGEERTQFLHSSCPWPQRTFAE